MAEAVDTRVRLDPDRRRDLELLAEDTGWSFNRVVNRAIKDMFGLHYIYRRQAAQGPPDAGRLLVRVVHEFGASNLVNRKLAYGVDEQTGEPLVRATDEVTGEESLFYADASDRLLVQRTVNGVIRHYAAKDGETVLLDARPAPGNPILN